MTADALLGRLAQLGLPARVEGQRAYLQVDLDHLGVPMADLRRTVREHLRTVPADRGPVLGLAADLWQHRVFEARIAAVEVLKQRRDLLGPGDLPLLERMLRECGTWALLDPLAADVVGHVAERHDAEAVLDRWASDDDVWLRRAALLSQLVPLRRGDGDPARFLRWADGLIEDRSFWVRKAIGWVLRDTGRRRPDVVAEWLLPRADRASGVTVREAVKPLPPDVREAVLARYRGAA